MARGGNRTPADPAPVSIPQSGARTDGGAGQPIRLASQQGYGERQALESAQGSAPMAAGGGSPVPPTGPTTPGGVMAGQPMPTAADIFGPTNRPNEPLGPSGFAPDQMGEIPADVILRKLYQLYPSPYIARLLSS
jgi:hypothetical protein